MTLIFENSIYGLLTYLDERIAQWNFIGRHDETGAMNLTYEIISDNQVTVTFGWSDYEESNSDEFTIVINPDNSATCISDNQGHSVMGGDYENKNTENFLSVTALINFLEEEHLKIN